MKRYSRILGALYGVAVGDALGAPIEFMNEREIKAQYGQLKDMVGGGWLNTQPGEVTDDTQMTLAVAEGIMVEPKNPIQEIGRRFIEWMKTGPKDIGTTCSSSITRAIEISHREAPEYEDWMNASQYTTQRNGGRSGGNGALMRIVYPGLYYKDEDEAVKNAEKIGSMTHWDEKSDRACTIYTRMVHKATEGMGLEEIIFSPHLKGSEYDREIITNGVMMPTGYVVDSLRCALNSICTTKSFESAIIRAVNLGGDADTIGAITGGLAGAIYGYNDIPERWINALDWGIRGRLDRAVNEAATNRLKSNT